MNCRSVVSGVVVAMVVCVGATASAQTSAGTISVTVTAGMEPSMSGTMHEGGSGRVLGLATEVDEKTWSDTHEQTGLSGSAGVGIGLNDRVEMVVNVEVGRINAQRLEVGTVATLPLFAEFDDYKYWGVNGGARLFLGSGSVSPYVTGTVGFRRLSELGGTFSVPAVSVTVPQPFFEESTVATFGGDVGMLFGSSRVKIGVQAGVRWTGGPNGDAASFAGTGLENLNDEGARLSIPVGVVVRF
jgi:hypothetical protein